MPKGRILHLTLTSVYSRIGRRLSAAQRGALSHLPAFFLLACTPQYQGDAPAPGFRKTQIYILPSGKATVQGLDLLFFQGAPRYLLDAWQHIDTPEGASVTGTSSSAAETLVALSNYRSGSWSAFRSRESLGEIRFRLADEDPAAPMLYGSVPAGETGKLVLSPMLARITLHSVACDFSRRPYAGETLRDVRAYLTYASAECSPFRPAEPPSAWINAGRLDEVETAFLAHPETVLRDISPSLGGRIYPEADFFCYPNPSDGQEFGRPVTRLVIEGRLRGTRYYYPIDLPSLEANVRYGLDVTLLRAGSTDPDVPVSSGTILLENRVMDWDGRVWDDVHFR